MRAFSRSAQGKMEIENVSGSRGKNPAFTPMARLTFQDSLQVVTSRNATSWEL
jgi:hypothetical protein